MLRRKIFGLTFAATVALATGTAAEQPQTAVTQTQSAASVVPAPDVRVAPEVRATPVAQSASCASECQAQHDRCRVQTKGSPSCDAERQRCLEICLQKKKK